MQAFKAILVVACLAGVASAASWPLNVQGRSHAESSSSDDCEGCKKFMEELKKNLPKYEHDQIVSCGEFETKEIQDECIENVKKSVKRFSKETPEEICQRVGRCPVESARARQAIDDFIDSHFHKRSQESPSMVCELCKADLEFIKKNIPKVEEEMYDFCKKMPIKDEQEQCMKRAKEFIDYLSKQTPEQICQDKGLCPRKTPFSELLAHKQPMCSILCEPCKQIAAQLKSGAPQAKDQLKKLCKNCGAPENVKKCEKAIDNFIEQVEEKSPEELCTEIGLCKKD